MTSANPASSPQSAACNQRGTLSMSRSDRRDASPVDREIVRDRAPGGANYRWWPGRFVPLPGGGLPDSPVGPCPVVPLWSVTFSRFAAGRFQDSGSRPFRSARSISLSSGFAMPRS